MKRMSSYFKILIGFSYLIKERVYSFDVPQLTFDNWDEMTKGKTVFVNFRSEQ